MAVHGRYGKPCPRCGEEILRIRYAGNETQLLCPLSKPPAEYWLIVVSRDYWDPTGRGRWKNWKSCEPATHENPLLVSRRCNFVRRLLISRSFARRTMAFSRAPSWIAPARCICFTTSGDHLHGDLFYVKSADSGATWSSPLRVNSEIRDVQSLPGTIRGGQIGNRQKWPRAMSPGTARRRQNRKAR